MLARAYARVFIALLIGSAMLTSTTQAQTTWYVDDNAPNDPGPGNPLVSDPNECGSAAHPFDAIQEGINAASNGDTVLVLDGMYTGTGNKNLGYGGKPIAVRSGSGPEYCIIDCEGDDHGFDFRGGETPDAVVEGFTMTNGHDDLGGGVHCYYSSPTVSNCLITGNWGRNGGGIYCYSSSPTISDCIVSGNEVFFYGGGVFCDYSSSPTLTNCTIIGNIATDPTISRAGGVHCEDNSSPTLVNCTISVNSGDMGGVFCGQYCSPTFANCAISGNSANSCGGGVFCWYEGNATLINCTITGNSAGAAGGGLYCFGGNPTFTNCVLWGDAPQEIYIYSSGSPVLTYCDIEGGWEGVGNIDANPLFADPDNGDFYLSAGSPCIDAGDNDGVPADTFDLDGNGDTTEPMPYDLDGNPRFVDDPGMPDSGNGTPPVVDVGAYEFQGATCFGDLDGDGDVDIADLAELLGQYGEPGPWTYGDGDLDLDGDVDIADLAALLAVYGTTCE